LRNLARALEGQDALRTTVVQELSHLRSETTKQFRYEILRGHCRELAPVLHAMERMRDEGDYSDPLTVQQHIESLIVTLEAVLARAGIERLPIAVGTDLFNSFLHECVRVCFPGDSPYPKAPARTIVHVQEHGYRIGDRLAVPAKVWVQRVDDQRNEGEEPCSTTK